MINYDIDKDLNIFLSFPDQAIPLTLKNYFRLKASKIKKIETRKIVTYSYEKECVVWKHS